MTRGLLALALALGCAPPEAHEDVVTVERGSLVVGVDVQGTLRAVDSDRMGPPPISGIWNYKIAMMAEEGSVVQPGEPVIVFDASDLQRTLDAKIAERDAAATQLELKLAAARVARQDERLGIAEAEAELRKAKVAADVPEGLTARIDLEKARLDRELAEEKVAYLQRKSGAAAQRDAAEVARWKSKKERADERVVEMQGAIATMKVQASRAGTVIHHTDHEGNKKKVGDSAWRAETVLHIASLTDMEGDGQIDEVDISKVAVDQSVALRLDAQADVEVRGQVRSISQSIARAAADKPLKVGRLVIAITSDPAVRLRPGMRFRGEIEIDRFDDAVLVPLDVVFATPDGPVVYREEKGSVHAVPIELGARNARWVIATGGVDEGDTLVRVDEHMQEARP